MHHVIFTTNIKAKQRMFVALIILLLISKFMSFYRRSKYQSSLKQGLRGLIRRCLGYFNVKLTSVWMSVISFVPMSSLNERTG